MARVMCGLAACVVVLALAMPAEADLVSYYRFENNTLNSVGGAPDGTRVGSGGANNLPQFVTGPTGLGTALDFDGTDDYVNTTTGGYPNSTGGLGTGSLSFWVKTTETSPFTFTGCFNVTGGTMAFQIQGNTGLTDGAGRLAGYLRPLEGVNYDMGFAVNSNAGWTDGGWHNILMTWQNEPGGVYSHSVFVDGTKQTTAVRTPDWIPSSTGTFSYGAWTRTMDIGRRPLAGNEQWADVTLDDYGVFGDQLTDGKAMAAYNLAVEADLLYNLGQASQLFDEFDAPGGGVNVGGMTWTKVTGLSGTAGDVVENGPNDFTVFLTDTEGMHGVAALIPEPGSAMLLLLGGALGLRRRRK